MKNKSFISWIINPFTHIAGGKALIIGLFIQLLAVFIGNMKKVHFDGALDMHAGPEFTLLQDFLLWGISIVSLILVLYIGGLILAKNFRFIDLAGTVLLARTPLVISMITTFFVKIPSAEAIMTNPLIVMTIPFLIFSILSLVLMIWFIALLYNAYKVSVGLPTDKAVISFIISIVIAEIISKLLINYLIF